MLARTDAEILDDIQAFSKDQHAQGSNSQTELFDWIVQVRLLISVLRCPQAPFFFLEDGAGL